MSNKSLYEAGMKQLSSTLFSPSKPAVPATRDETNLAVEKTDPLTRMFPSPPVLSRSSGSVTMPKQTIEKSKENQKKKKKKKTKAPRRRVQDEESSSSSDDNEGNLSFVDDDVDDDVPSHLFIKPKYFSKSKMKEREKKKKKKSSLILDEADEDDEDADSDEFDDDDEDDSVENFKRPDGSDFRYTSDEFVRIDDGDDDDDDDDDESFRMGEDEEDESPSPSPPSSSSSSLLSSPISSSSSPVGSSPTRSGERRQSSRRMEIDEVEEVVKEAQHVLAVTDHRQRRSKPRELTSTTSKALAIERELLATAKSREGEEDKKRENVEVDSEADTVDFNLDHGVHNDPMEIDEEDEEDGGGLTMSATDIENVHACVDKVFERLQVKAPNCDLIPNPLTLMETSSLYQVMTTLTGILLSAAIEQQTSKNIQTHITLGCSNIPGQSASRKQSEMAQEALHYLDEIGKKNVTLALLTHALEEEAH